MPSMSALFNTHKMICDTSLLRISNDMNKNWTKQGKATKYNDFFENN